MPVYLPSLETVIGLWAESPFQINLQVTLGYKSSQTTNRHVLQPKFYPKRHSTSQLRPKWNYEYFLHRCFVLGGQSWLYFCSTCPVCVMCWVQQEVVFTSLWGDRQLLPSAQLLLIKPVSDIWVHILGSDPTLSFSICLDLLICSLICLANLLLPAAWMKLTVCVCRCSSGFIALCFHHMDYLALPSQCTLIRPPFHLPVSMIGRARGEAGKSPAPFSQVAVVMAGQASCQHVFVLCPTH